jgi:Terminase RNaseH-like domain
MADYTAAVVVERVEPTGGQATYHVRQILRVRNKPYPDIVTAVRELLSSPDLRGAMLIVDGTGVGVAVVDMFRAAGMLPIGITITAGIDHERVIGGYHVPKRALVSVTEVLLQQGRVRIAAGLPHARTLTDELANFEVHISAAGHDTYSAREGEHDDLVLAAAMALWFGEIHQPVRFI